MEPREYIELEVTWRRATRVWWSYFWRNMIAILASLVIGGIIGGILGFVLGALGTPVGTIKIIVMPIGFIIGVLISIVPMKMILGKNFGEFRLVLIQDKDSTKS